MPNNTPFESGHSLSFKFHQERTNNKGKPALGYNYCKFKTKLDPGLALRQRANISTNKISLPQGQSYTERKYLV